MSVPEREALDEAGADWYEWLFRGSEAFAALLGEAALDVVADDFDRTDAYRPGGLRRFRPVVLRLTREGSGPEVTFEGDPDDEVEHLTLTARFDPEADELVAAELRTGVMGELAGRGEVWRWEDGAVQHGRWTA